MTATKKTTSKKTAAPAKETTPPAQAEPKPKKLGCLDAAAKLLSETGKSMTAKAMIEAMTDRGLWTSPGGKTPHATLYAAILREIATKAEKARFRKTAPGHFAFNPESKD